MHILTELSQLKG